MVRLRWRPIGLVGVIAALSLGWIAASPSASASETTGWILGPAAPSGRVSIDQAGGWRELTLADAPPANVDARLHFGVSAAPTGRGLSAVVVARRSSRGNEYRVRLHLMSTGRVEASIVRVVDGRRAVLAETGPIASVRANKPIAMRVVVYGSSPSVIAVKVWPSGTSQPSDWTATATDNATALASRGSSGVRFSIAPNVSGVPVSFAYWNLRTAQATSSPIGPLAQSRATAAPTSTPAASSTPTAGPVSTPAPTPAPPTATPTASPVQTPSPAPSSTPGADALPSDARYVSPTGSDGANGSSSAPWRTLQRAADLVGPGDTVVVRAGTYGPVTMRRSGTSYAPITFRAYPGEQPVVDGAGAVPYTVRLVGVSNVVLDGLTVQGGFAERQAGGGVSIESSSRITVRHSVLRDNHSYGIRSYDSTYVTISDNDIYGNAVGVHVGRAGQGTVVRDNLIHENTQMMVNTADVPGDDAGAEGVALVRSTGTVTVTGNYIWGNRSPSFDYGYDGGAFSVYAASNWHITGNVTWDNRNVFEAGTDSLKTPCDGGEFTRNLNYGATTVDRTVGMVLRCASNTLVANNTFRGMQYFVFDISHMRGGWGGSIEGLRIVNNVVSVSTGKIYGIESELPASVVLDYNVLDDAGPGYLATVLGKGTRSLAEFRSWTGQEQHGVAADPAFVDPSGNDYRLRAVSPALDSGTFVPGITDDYAGAAPDRGYVERH